MKIKPFQVMFIILLFSSLISVSFGMSVIKDEGVNFFAPERISVLDTFQIKFEIKDSDIRDYANVLDMSNCNYFIYNNPEIKNDLLLKNNYKNPLLYYEYNGEKEVILELGSVIHPYVSETEITNTYCTIHFKRILTSKDREKLPKTSDGFELFEQMDSKKNSYYADLAVIEYSPVTAPVKIDIKLPYPKENSVKSTVLVSGHTPYDKQPSYTYSLRFSDYGYNLVKEDATASMYDSNNKYVFDFKEPDYKDFFENEVEDLNKDYFLKAGQTQLIDYGLLKSVGGKSGFYKFYHSVYDTPEKSNEKEDYVSVTTRFLGRINFHGPRNMPIELGFTKNKVLKEDAEQVKSDNEKELLELINTITIDDENIDYPVYEKTKTNTEEKKDVDSRKFEIEFSNKGEKTIWNRGRINTGEEGDSFEIGIKIDATAYDSDGKKIKKPSNNDLYGGIKLVAKIVNTNESQIGFDSDLSLTSSKSVDSYMQTIDVRGKGPRLYKGIYMPQEVIEIYIEENGKNVSNKLEYYVNIKDASPNINLKDANIEVQDGDKRGISFSVQDPDKSKLVCYMMIPTGFAIKGGIPMSFLEYDHQETTLVKVDCKDGDTIKAIYHAPNFGNFDLNNELNALSMWKMQEGTMTSLVTDLVGFGVEKRLDQLKSSSDFYNKAYKFTDDIDNLKNAQQFEKAADYLEKGNSMATDAQNLIKLTQAKKNTDALEKQANEAIGTGKQGWIEWGSDWGVFGIDVAQSTVGAIAMAPGKLPVLGPLGKKVGAGFSTAFNLMTNVWRGNLAYLSKVEKINRAKEMYFPYPVIITIEDQDGFVTKEIQNVMVVYNWLE